MKKTINLIMFIIIFVSMLLIITGCGKQNYEINNNTENNKENEHKRIIVACIVINSRSNEIKNNKKIQETFKEIINSDHITQKIQNKYIDAQKVDLDFIEDSDLIRIVYPCDKYSIDEQKDIVNMYILEFAGTLNEIYNIDSYIIDQPEEYGCICNDNLDKNLDDVRPVVIYNNNKYVLESKLNTK